MEKAIGSVDKLLEHIGKILRYIAPGFVALLVWKLLFLNSFDSKLSSTEWVTAALVGALIYAIHTGVFIRLFWFPISIIICKYWLKKGGKNCQVLQYGVFKAVFELDTQRSLRRASENKEVIGVQKGMDEWAALISFTFCSSYSIIAISLIKIYTNYTLLSRNLFIAGLVLMLCAFISEFRNGLHEIWQTEKYWNGKIAAPTAEQDANNVCETGRG